MKKCNKSYSIVEDNNKTYIEINNTDKFAEIIDGQNRIEGIKSSEHIDEFDMPVLFMIGVTPEEKAYIFNYRWKAKTCQ